MEALCVCLDVEPERERQTLPDGAGARESATSEYL